MLVCNNCGTVNEADTGQCIHCRIQNGFTKVADPNGEKAATATRQCLNCGKMIGVHHPKCPDCRFPVREMQATSAAHKPGKTYTLGNLKAG